MNGTKSKTITNDAPEYDWVDIGGEMVDILKPSETHRYLGRHLPGELSNRANVEINSRMKAAWFKFGKLSRTLTNRCILVKLRLKLFDAIISPTILFGLVALPMHGSNLEKLDVVLSLHEKFSEYFIFFS